MTGKVLVTGASGVVGTAAVESFLDAGWDVVALSRRVPEVNHPRPFRHISADLQDSAASHEVIGALTGVTHVVFAALYETAGLIAGWSDVAQMETNLAMLRNCLEPLIAAGNRLGHVSLMQGTKAYGLHLHPMPIPAREDKPRDPHPNFYWLQEDYLKVLAASRGFGFTILRPPMVLGAAYGAAMNVVPVIGAYAAICREEGLSFGFPGGPPFVLEAMDTRVLAKAFVWAADAPSARNQHFNLTNGDVFDWRHLWPAIADALGVEPGPDRPCSMASFLPTRSAVWDRIVAKHGLRPIALPALLGESHHVTDFCFASGALETPTPAFMSTIKIRKAGFTEVCDTEEMFRYWIGNFIARSILPPREA